MTRLTEQLKIVETRLKEMSVSTTRITELETEKSELKKQVRGHKSEVSSMREEF